MSDLFVSNTNVAIDMMDEQLAIDLIDLIPDTTKTGLVRFGNLQDDPTIAQLNVLIHRGGEHWKDELKLDDTGIVTMTPYEVGGGQWWWRRYVIQLIFFFDNELDRQVARKKANTVLPRIQRSLFDLGKNGQLPLEEDDFGESFTSIQVRDCYLEESGGEGEFIWRGEVRVEFLAYIKG